MNTEHISYLNRQIIPYSFSVIRPPNDKIGKVFVNKLADLINRLLQREFNSEYILLFMILITYKVPDCTSASNIKKLMKDRLDRFEDPSKLGQLISEAEEFFKSRQSKLWQNLTSEEVAKVFKEKLEHGDVKNAIKYLCDREGGWVLSPEDPADPEVPDRLVKDVLKEKHPPLRENDIMAANLVEFDSVPDLHRVWITEDTVEKVTGKLHGSAEFCKLANILML